MQPFCVSWFKKKKLVCIFLASLLSRLQIYFNLDFWISLRFQSGDVAASDLIFSLKIISRRGLDLFNRIKRFVFNIQVDSSITTLVCYLGVDIHLKRSWWSFFSWVPLLFILKVCKQCPGHQIKRGNSITCSFLAANRQSSLATPGNGRHNDNNKDKDKCIHISFQPQPWAQFIRHTQLRFWTRLFNIWKVV